MNKVDIEIDGKTSRYQCPSEWNEMSEKQLVTWAAICLKKLRLPLATRLTIIAMYGIPLSHYFRLPEAGIAQLAYTLRFLFGKNTLTKWVIPSIHCGFRKYYGPQNRLENITVSEFCKLLLYYQAYVKRNDENALDLLIATLYRPKRKGKVDKDIREDLSEHSTRQRAKRMRIISGKYRQAILLNFEGCYSFIRENFLNKLPSEGEGSSTEIFDFNNVVLTVAGGKFGTKAETEKALLYDFLRHLVITAEEIAKMKKKQ